VTIAGAARVLIAADMSEPESIELAGGRVAFYTCRRPGGADINEDAMVLLPAGARRAALVLADGFGGLPAGEQASRLAVAAAAEAIEAAAAGGGELQAGILAGFDRANDEVRALGVGAATTLAVVEIDDGRVRSYHVGDSEVLIVGQRGRIKLQTIAHSPVGYSVEAGLLDADAAMEHEDRHVVSNVVGSGDMRIDVGPVVHLNPRDTLVVATDGLFDNLRLDEICQAVRKGDLAESTGDLVTRCRQRMQTDGNGPSKPDDLSVMVYRRSGRRDS